MKTKIYLITKVFIVLFTLFTVFVLGVNHTLSIMDVLNPMLVIWFASISILCCFVVGLVSHVITENFVLQSRYEELNKHREDALNASKDAQTMILKSLEHKELERTYQKDSMFLWGLIDDLYYSDGTDLDEVISNIYGCYDKARTI